MRMIWKKIVALLLCSCFLFSGCGSKKPDDAEIDKIVEDAAANLQKSIEAEKQAYEDVFGYMTELVEASNTWVTVFNENPDLVTDKSQIVSLSAFEDFKDAKAEIFDIHDKVIHYDREYLGTNWIDLLDTLSQWSALVKEFYTDLDKGVKGTELTDRITAFTEKQMELFNATFEAFKICEEDLNEVLDAQAKNAERSGTGNSNISYSSGACKFKYSSGAVCGAPINDYIDLCDKHFHELNNTYQYFVN